MYIIITFCVFTIGFRVTTAFGTHDSYWNNVISAINVEYNYLPQYDFNKTHVILCSILIPTNECFSAIVLIENKFYWTVLLILNKHR